MLARARLPCKKLSRKMRCCGKLAGDQWSPLHTQQGKNTFFCQSAGGMYPSRNVSAGAPLHSVVCPPTSLLTPHSSRLSPNSSLPTPHLTNPPSCSQIVYTNRWSILTFGDPIPERSRGRIRLHLRKPRMSLAEADQLQDYLTSLPGADVGIAISDGAAIAREIADVTIAADSLRELVILKSIANGLQKRTESNYRFIMSFNSTLIVLGAMGILPPATSALLHNASTLGVSLKSMTNLLD